MTADPPVCRVVDSPREVSRREGPRPSSRVIRLRSTVSEGDDLSADPRDFGNVAETDDIRPIGGGLPARLASFHNSWRGGHG